jgi:hypothetical protein
MLQIFAGNTDNMSPVTNTIQFPFQAKYVRLYPVSWHNGAAVRFEIMGCVQGIYLHIYHFVCKVFSYIFFVNA